MKDGGIVLDRVKELEQKSDEQIEKNNMLKLEIEELEEEITKTETQKDMLLLEEENIRNCIVESLYANPDFIKLVYEQTGVDLSKREHMRVISYNTSKTILDLEPGTPKIVAGRTGTVSRPGKESKLVKKDDKPRAEYAAKKLFETLKQLQPEQNLETEK